MKNQHENAVRGSVYVLSNAAMPGLVKIGRTGGEVEARVAALNSSGVPEPFKIECAVEVEDCVALERAMHFRFARYRENQRREFFRVEVWRVVDVLTEMAGRERVVGEWPAW